MLTASYRRPHDLLARRDLMPGPVHGARLAFKIAVGALLGLLLAVAGNLSEPPQDVERLAPLEVGPTPSVAADPTGPWERRQE
jgi:hypothetical protein